MNGSGAAQTRRAVPQPVTARRWRSPVVIVDIFCDDALGREILVSADFLAAAMDGGSRLESPGRHALRGVREPKEIFALASSASR